MSQFHTIVADPPWQVSAGRSIGRYEVVNGKQPFGVTDNAARKLSYPSMTLQAITALPVASIAKDDAHLYLWTINKYLQPAFDVMRTWTTHRKTAIHQT